MVPTGFFSSIADGVPIGESMTIRQDEKIDRSYLAILVPIHQQLEWVKRRVKETYKTIIPFSLLGLKQFLNAPSRNINKELSTLVPSMVTLS